MGRIAADPPAVRRLAAFIHGVLEGNLTGQQEAFLADLEKFKGPELLTMRQREWLHALRGRATRRSVVKGFRASTLIRKLWQARLDFDEGAEEFLIHHYEQAQKVGHGYAVSEPSWRYLFRLARQIGEIDEWVEVA